MAELAPQFAGPKATRTCRPQTHHCLVVWTGPPEKTSACRLRRCFQVEPGGGQTRPRSPSPENTPSNRAPVGAQAAEQLLDQQTSLTHCSARALWGVLPQPTGPPAQGSVHLPAPRIWPRPALVTARVGPALPFQEAWPPPMGGSGTRAATSPCSRPQQQRRAGTGYAWASGPRGTRMLIPGSCPGP